MGGVGKDMEGLFLEDWLLPVSTCGRLIMGVALRCSRQLRYSVRGGGSRSVAEVSNIGGMAFWQSSTDRETTKGKGGGVEC